MPTLLIFDLETIPSHVPAPPPSSPGRKPPFPPAPCHEIAVAGVMLVSPNGVLHAQPYISEPVATQELAMLAVDATHLVTFNGGGFDVPVCIHAAMRHRVDISSLLRLAGRDRHIDVAWALRGNSSSSPLVSLDQCSKSIGLRGKGEVDGKQVAALWEQDPGAVARYCMEDVVQTAVLACRWLAVSPLPGMYPDEAEGMEHAVRTWAMANCKEVLCD